MSTLDGLPALNRRLEAIKDNRSLLKSIQIEAVREAKRAVPRKTGNLGRSISPGSIAPSFAIVQATAPYAGFVELGTKPHTIRPRTKRALAWAASGSGRRLSGRPTASARRGGSGGLRFAKVVKHPGTKAQPFLVPAARIALRSAGLGNFIERWNRAA